MPRFFPRFGTSDFPFLFAAVGLGLLMWCVIAPPASASSPLPPPAARKPQANLPMGRVVFPFPVLLGIDVLEADGFPAVQGKKIGLLTHPAGVNRKGESTIDVLRRAPGVELVALFGPEHGLYGTEKAAVHVADTVDRRTGLPVYSLYGSNAKPTAAQLKGLDAMVIDLQDIGVRSYTFNVVMRYAIDACFQHGVEVIVLDRPNPLGGLKVDGPNLDRELRSGVGAYPIPYVHGLTIGELARWAAATPGVLDVSEEVRARGRLTVISMRGWRRSMRWPETGLTFVPTSQNVRDFAGVVGYAMVGLGCEYSGFGHGIGTPHPFRSLAFGTLKAEKIERDLRALKLPGLRYRLVKGEDSRGQKTSRVYVEVSDWEAWNPTELSFHLHRLACAYAPPNPFARIGQKEKDLFNKHVGSKAWWTALERDGGRVDVEGFQKEWRAKAEQFRRDTIAWRLYP